MAGDRAARRLALAYVLLIYTTSGWMRDLSTLARQAAGDRLGPAMTAGLLLVLAAVLLALRRRYLRPGALQALIPVLCGYGLALAWLKIPEERFHLLQYGVLSLLCTRALPPSLRGPRRHLAALLLVCLAGAGDELIQGLRPNRVGDLRDIAINAIAALLAQVLIAIAAPPRTTREAAAAGP